MAHIIDKIIHPIRHLKNSRGQTLVEYALLLILIAVVVIAAVTVVGQKTNTKFSEIATSIP
ncbi:MAG: Flp family type IVb pilin [Geobacteraceae bacterium]|jgi:pilus assembly protein Flp/PilA